MKKIYNKPNYGIDAPTIVRNFALIGFIITLVSALFLRSTYSWINVVAFLSLLSGLYFIFASLAMLLSSKYGKLYQAKHLVALLQLKGGEKILDVGCGKGLLLIEVAKQLPTGKALGIDIWNQQDLSYNTKSATIDNATIEGVKDKVEIINTDVRSLPFADQSFDAVISSMVIHNIANQVEKKRLSKK